MKDYYLKDPKLGDAERERMRYFLNNKTHTDQTANLKERRLNYLWVQDEYTREWDEKHGYPHSHNTGGE